jgi:hypothetical protein
MRLNQYFITDNQSTNVEDFNRHKFNEFTVYNHENLNVSFEETTDVKVLLLGYIINPFVTELSNLKITKQLSKLTTKQAVLEYLEKCSGRFVLLISICNDTFVITDCMALRQVYYYFKDDFTYLSSNEKLLLDTLNLEPEISTEKKALVKDTVFLNIQEHWFLSESNWDNRLKRLAPNQLLNIIYKKTERIPLYNIDTLSYEAVIKESSTILNNSLLAVSKRYKLSVPITSGYDSRLMLAAGLAEGLKMENFIFNREGTYVKRDVASAKELAKEFNLNFKVITTEVLNQDFINDYNKQFIVPRLLQKTQNIQWFKNNLKSKEKINIVGIGGGLLKAFYNEDKFITIDNIIKEVDVDCNNINKKAVSEWLESTTHYAKKYNINLSDLFFLEIRTGLWASKTSLELDYAELEEFSPFNNRYFIYSLLKNTTIDQRKSLRFYKDLLEQTYSGITTISLNPDTWRDIIKKIVFYDSYKKWFHKIKY